jgi:hypothetical protein
LLQSLCALAVMEAANFQAMMAQAVPAPSVSKDEERIAKLAHCCAKSQAVAQDWVARSQVGALLYRT